MRRSALAALGALLLALLLLLAACPSLSDIGVGGAGDATFDRTAPKPEGGPDAGRDAARMDSGVDAPCFADVAADPKNCGRCGHDCLGGGCADGSCEPVVLYSGSEIPSSIAVFGPTLFVTLETDTPDGGAVIRCSTDDCMATATVIASGLLNPGFAVMHGSTILWVDEGSYLDEVVTTGSVVGCPAAGCPDSGPVVYVPQDAGIDGGLGVISGLAVDSTYLYWGESWILRREGTYVGGIYRCDVTDCAHSITALAGSVNAFPVTVAVDPDYVYWTDEVSNEVLRCGLPCSGATNLFAKMQSFAYGLALYDSQVYWTLGKRDGGVFRCPASGCGASVDTVAAQQADPAVVAADDSGVYWTNSDNGAVMHSDLAGCPEPTPIAHAVSPYAVALDPVSVYFSNSGEFGRVLRVAK
jgi:hypothetical protein